MDGKMVLLSILEDSRKRYHWVVGELDDAALYWQPDPEANSIAITIWHVSRVFDVFLAQKLMAVPAAQELWFRNGWADRTGYDPRGLGVNDWGNLIGYTPDEVKAVPHLDGEQLLLYFDEAVTAFGNFIESMAVHELDEPSAGEKGHYRNFDWLKLGLLNMTRHIGEILAIKAMYERQA